MNDVSSTTESGWRSLHTVPASYKLVCQLGPLNLQIRNESGEWRLLAQHEAEAADATPSAQFELVQEPLDDEKVERYIGPVGRETLRFKPVLPDRPVVIRPRQPIFLPSRMETVLYLSTPVWLQVEVVADQPVVLKEVPALELSDTWFGPSTREGELCYSDKSRARSDPAEVPFRAHRVLTPVRVRNEANSVLPLDKLSLPVPALSVYGAADGSLHTQSMSLVRAADSDMAALSIDERPIADAGPTEKLSEPRQAGRSGLVRAFSLLFGK